MLCFDMRKRLLALGVQLVSIAIEFEASLLKPLP